MSITVALDVDGVLADFNTRMRHVMAEEYGFLDPNTIQIIQWDFNHAYGLTKAEEKHLMARIFASNDHFPPMPGAIEGVNGLVERGHDVIITTSRKDPGNTQEWLEINGLDFIQPYYIDLEDAPKFDFLLDDSPKKMGKLRNNIQQQAFLFNSEQNKDCVDIFDQWIRVYGWDGFLDTLDATVTNVR